MKYNLNRMNNLRKVIIVTLLAVLPSALQAQETDTLQHEVLIETTMGNIRVALYNETPLHRDHFLKMVNDGFYDSLLFHRVIYNFMIQTGDPESRDAAPGELLGLHSEGEQIPAEIVWPVRWHKRGALAAARQGDATNPERKSSGSQFYIVYGRRYDDRMMDEVQQRLDKETGGKIQMTPALREAYYKTGGSPHLDGQYTVFGEVVEGLDVVKQIQWAQTDGNARPLEDIRIVKATQVK